MRMERLVKLRINCLVIWGKDDRMTTTFNDVKTKIINMSLSFDKTLIYCLSSDGAINCYDMVKVAHVYLIY